MGFRWASSSRGRRRAGGGLEESDEGLDEALASLGARFLGGGLAEGGGDLLGGAGLEGVGGAWSEVEPVLTQEPEGGQASLAVDGSGEEEVGGLVELEELGGFEGELPEFLEGDAAHAVGGAGAQGGQRACDGLDGRTWGEPCAAACGERPGRQGGLAPLLGEDAQGLAASVDACDDRQAMAALVEELDDLTGLERLLHRDRLVSGRGRRSSGGPRRGRRRARARSARGRHR